MKIYKLSVKNNDLLQEVNDFLKGLLRQKIVDAILVPQETPSGKHTLPTLVKEEAALEKVNAFIPFLLLNGAQILSQLSRDHAVEKIGVLLRPCEIRAAIELCKLKQIQREGLVFIGVDCLGTYEPKAYNSLLEAAKDTGALTREFMGKAAQGEACLIKGEPLRLACQGCEHPVPEQFDLAINTFGCDVNKEVLIQVCDDFKIQDPQMLALIPVEDNAHWKDVVEAVRQKRTRFRDELFAACHKEIGDDIRKLIQELENCRRCYNCRRACPICYCRECIFDAQLFEHQTQEYLTWAQRKGRIRMPTDTLLFHLTRMNHMVVSCVACGQCTSACPQEIAIGKFFKTIGFKVQGVFDYQAGRSLEEEIPQATFKEDEFPEVGK